MEVQITKKKKWLKRIGIAGFILFLIKGLIWIGIILWAYMGFKK